MKLLDFNKTFNDEESCEQYLRELREKDGVVCKTCGNKHQYWDKHNTCWVCSKCHHRTTLTADTLFHGSKRKSKVLVMVESEETIPTKK